MSNRLCTILCKKAAILQSKRHIWHFPYLLWLNIRLWFYILILAHIQAHKIYIATIKAYKGLAKQNTAK